ncbi:MAG: hypothetical protein Q9227_006985 [Pyrenula ochraceoflavens]
MSTPDKPLPPTPPQTPTQFLAFHRLRDSASASHFSASSSDTNSTCRVRSADDVSDQKKWAKRVYSSEKIRGQRSMTDNERELEEDEVDQITALPEPSTGGWYAYPRAMERTSNRPSKTRNGAKKERPSLSPKPATSRKKGSLLRDIVKKIPRPSPTELLPPNPSQYFDLASVTRRRDAEHLSHPVTTRSSQSSRATPHSSKAETLSYSLSKSFAPLPNHEFIYNPPTRPRRPSEHSLPTESSRENISTRVGNLERPRSSTTVAELPATPLLSAFPDSGSQTPTSLSSLDLCTLFDHTAPSPSVQHVPDASSIESCVRSHVDACTDVVTTTCWLENGVLHSEPVAILTDAEQVKRLSVGPELEDALRPRWDSEYAISIEPIIEFFNTYHQAQQYEEALYSDRTLASTPTEWHARGMTDLELQGADGDAPYRDRDFVETSPSLHGIEVQNVHDDLPAPASTTSDLDFAALADDAQIEKLENEFMACTRALRRLREEFGLGEHVQEDRSWDGDVFWTGCGGFWCKDLEGLRP